MGLFDRFKKPAAPPPRALSPLLGELIGRYGLKRTDSPEDAGLGGEWSEGRYEGRLIAFDERGRNLFLYLGEPAEVTEIYLVAASPGESQALADTRRQIERIGGAEGTALAARFRLGASPSGDRFDIPALRLPALREGLPRLSASVREVSIFDNLGGLALTLDDAATLDSIAADLDIAHAALRALAAEG